MHEEEMLLNLDNVVALKIIGPDRTKVRSNGADFEVKEEPGTIVHSQQ